MLSQSCKELSLWMTSCVACLLHELTGMVADTILHVLEDISVHLKLQICGIGVSLLH